LRRDRVMRRVHFLKTLILAVLVTSGAHATVGVTTLGVSAALSPAEAYPRKVRRACKYDYKRMCPRYKVGTAKMRSCMRSKVGQLSPRCYDTLVRYGYGKRRR
jgi:hypothetical protein